MNDGLKQRIIGALVLLALGIIFLPVIFDRERIVPVDRNSQIPPEPAHQILTLPEPPVAPRPKSDDIAQPIDGRFDIEEPPAKVAEVVAPTAKTSTDKNTKEKQDSLKPTWVLQVASFESKARALEVLKQLEALRYRGFIREVTTASGSRTRLFVGPNVNKPKLQQAKTKIDKELKVDSFILRFRP